MEIKVDMQVCGHHDVYADGKLVGTLRKFCCGIDFRPDGHQAIFSIMPFRNPKCREVKDSIRAILNINIPDGHWNFNVKIADSAYSLIEYQELINNHKGKRK